MKKIIIIIVIKDILWLLQKQALNAGNAIQFHLKINQKMDLMIKINFFIFWIKSLQINKNKILFMMKFWKENKSNLIRVKIHSLIILK